MIRMLVVAMVVALSPGAVAAAQQPNGRAWLALGDSYSSGEGIKHTPPSNSSRLGRDCLRATGENMAPTAWAAGAYQQVRDQFGITGQRFVACTGAISDEAPRQIEEALERERAEGTGRTKWDVVSFSFGGNNIRFSSVIKGCIGLRVRSWGKYPKRALCVESESQLRKRVDMLTGRTPIDRDEFEGELTYPELLDTVVDSVAPGGDVIVLGYPNVIEDPARWPADKGRCSLVSRQDAPMLRSVGGYLNEQIRTAVAAANLRYRGAGIKFHFLDIARNPYELDDNPANRHGRCTQDDWLNGFQVDMYEAGHRVYANRSYHPHQKGHTATAAVVADYVRDNVTFEDVPAKDPNAVIAAYLSTQDSGQSLLRMVTGSGTALPVLDVRPSPFSGQVAFSPDGKWLGVAGDNRILFVDTAKPSQTRTVACECRGVAFNTDNHAVSVNWKGEIVFIDPAKGDRPIRTVSLKSGIDRDIESSGAQISLAAAGAGIVVLFEPETGRILVADNGGAMVHVNADPLEYPGLITVSRDGTRVAFGSSADCGRKGPKITVIRDISFLPPTFHRSSFYAPGGDSARGTIASLAFEGDALVAGWHSNALTQYGGCGARGKPSVSMTSVPDPSSETQPGTWFPVMQGAGQVSGGMHTTPTSGSDDRWDLTDGTRRLGQNAAEVWVRPGV